MTPEQAIEAIKAVLDGTHWDPDTLDAIVKILHDYDGFVPADCSECPNVNDSNTVH